jgi:hypothetical protein
VNQASLLAALDPARLTNELRFEIRQPGVGARHHPITIIQWA